jgi:hypothetical protein
LKDPLGVRVTRLLYSDEVLGRLTLPARDMVITRGIGSGLSRRFGDPPNRVWAIGDRGPNFKVPLALQHYGLEHLEPFAENASVKVMPTPEFGPAISELFVEGDKVTCIRTIALKGQDNHPLSGLPFSSDLGELAIDLDGKPILPDPSGVDSESIAAMADGTFWVADEYGPSLLHVSADGRVLVRWVPIGFGHRFEGATYPIIEALPAIAAMRQFNRGFEAVTQSADEASLYVAFQSPLAHPDEEAHRHGRHVRIWELSTATGKVSAQFLYPLDKPSSFHRDNAIDKVRWSDLKVSELVSIGQDHLLVLERGSATSKLYKVGLGEAFAIDESHLNLETRPTLEALSAEGQIGQSTPQLHKTLVFNSDDHPDIDADLEGVVMLGPREFLLVNDNDFGVEGVSTSFWRVELPVDV